MIEFIDQVIVDIGIVLFSALVCSIILAPFIPGLICIAYGKWKGEEDDKDQDY